MFGGHDTTANSVTFFCYLIGMYPEIQRKLHEEMDSIFGDDHERECTMEDLENMTYLDCVIKLKSMINVRQSKRDSYSTRKPCVFSLQCHYLLEKPKKTFSIVRINTADRELK